MTQTAAATELKISIVVPVHAGGDAFFRCLSSVRDAISDGDELIVVADGSVAESIKTAEQFGARVLRTPVPRGPAAARNLGAKSARGDILLFIDADIVVPSDLVTRFRETFQQDPDVSALIGSYDDDPSAGNFLSQYRNLMHCYVHQIGREDAFTFWGACGAIRRSVFREVGGFDDSYTIPSIEDIELGYRLKRRGHRIRLDKQLQVKHQKRWTATSMVHTDFRARALPWTRLILQQGQLPNDLNLRHVDRASVLLSGTILAAVLATLWWPVAIGVAALLGAAFVTLNAPLYRFFWQRKGAWFALLSMPWHWLFHFSSGVAFVLGCIEHPLRRRLSRKSEGWNVASAP